MPGIFQPGTRNIVIRDKGNVPMYCVDHMVDGDNVDVWFNPTTEQIVRVFFWVNALTEWIDVTDYVLNPDNRRLYDKYLVEVINIRREISDDKKLQKEFDNDLKHGFGV